MWTPKRMLLLMAGIALFCSAYVGYAHFLGGIDGLPELPEDYWPKETAINSNIEPPSPRLYIAEKKLLQAFGENEQIKNCPIKVEISARGLVIAAEEFHIEDGRVRLTPFFLAIFGKEKADTKSVEINTVRSKEAYLRFDRPVGNFTEMSNRKIIGGTLRHDIMIVNNRRTPQQDDDISLFTHGPVEYDESLHRIWTTADVRILDPQPKPEPMTITATEADVFLTVEEPPTKGSSGSRKNKSEGISGVDRIRLRRDVDMNLWVDARSGFLGAPTLEEKGAKPDKPKEKSKGIEAKGKSSPAALAKAAEPERARVTIQTQGPFNYDLKKDHATFDISQHPNPSPNHVVVKRLNEREGKLEQLICDHLDLQFRRKNGPDSKTPRDDRSVDLEIETAHATGPNVTLTSDAENLNAFGTDLVYDAKTKQSVLKGEPEMVAAKDGNFIHARELRLWNDPKGAHRAHATGPGFIEMLDRTSGDRPLLARWNRELVYGREGEFDLLILTDEASFEDKVQGQQLHGDLLKVWLKSGEPTGPAVSETQRRLPHHLEATGHVKTSSAEMRVHDTERLVVWFHDGPPAGAPAIASAAPGTAPGQLMSNPAARQPATPASPVPPPSPADKPTSAPNAKPKQPIDLSARSVEAHVRRSGNKNDLEKLWCEGKVLVKQAPTSPEDKGVDIRGDTMQLTRQAEGNVLAVTGDPAWVQLDKLFILGPEVNIDQPLNKAWVNGGGLMRMPTNSNFEGGKLSKPSEMTILWNKSMFFNGKFADFHGGVQAKQDNSRLLCQAMQVFLDPPVSLREGEKQSQQPRIDKVVCDENVRVEDSLQENGKLKSYKRIETQVLALDNEDGKANAGPGVVRILQPGNKGDELVGANNGKPAAPANQSAPAAGQPAAAEELKLTRVTYKGSMCADNKKRMATFLDQVEVVHVPTQNPDLAIDIEHLPRGALYLRCELLKVYSRQMPDGRTSQEMEAYKKVIVETQEIRGFADKVTYDESQEKVTLEAVEGGAATLYRFTVVGARPEETRARKITYFRRTGEVKFDDVRDFRR